MSGLETLKDQVQEARNDGAAAQSSLNVTDEQGAKTFVKQVNSMIEGVEFVWAEVVRAIDTVQNYLTDTVRLALKSIGIDGLAMEFSLSGGASAGVGTSGAFGLSIFFPIHSEFDPADNANDDGSLPPHPIDDAPFFFLFSASSFSGGLQAGGGVDLNAEAVIAKFWADPAGINRDCWSGSIASVDVTIEAGILGKVAASASAFSSVKVPEKEKGKPRWFFPEQGWYGAVIGAGTGGGGEFGFSVGLTLTNAAQDLLSFSNVAVTRMVKRYERMERQGKTPMKFKYKKSAEKSATPDDGFWELFTPNYSWERDQ